MTRNQLNITVGSDVILNVTLVHEEETLIPALIDNIEANLITGLGTRTALETGLGADYITIAIPWVEGRLAGCYSLEVKGSINGLAWAAIGKGLIRYTNATEAGANSVTVEADAYDVTMEVGFHFSDSPIKDVEVTVDGQTGEPSVEHSYKGRILKLGFHRLKGETGETGPQGPQGVPGDSAVFDPSTGNISTMKQTTGNDTLSPMSQKAVTDELTSLVLSRDLSSLTALDNRYWISPALRWRSTTENEKGKRLNVTQYRGLQLDIVPQSGKSVDIGFLTGWGTASEASAKTLVHTWCDGETLRTISEETSLTVPSDAVYLYLRYLNGGTNVLPQSLEIRSKLADSIVPLSNEIAKLSAEMDAMMESGILDIATEVYVDSSITATKAAGNNTYNINTSTNKYESPGKNGARYINITAYKGKTMRVTPQEGKHAYFAFITDDSPHSGDTVNYAGDSEYNNITDVTTIQVPDVEGNVYLWYNFNKSVNDNNVCPQAVEMVKTFSEELDEVVGRPSVVYVNESSGSDDNPGTSEKPVATIETAMNKGGANLKIILANSVTRPIDFSKWDGEKTHVTLCGARNTRGLIRVGKKLEGLNPVDGHDDVYEWAPGSGESNPSGDYRWLWQHNIPDASTAIPYDEIHPLQRRRVYRRLSTHIDHVESLDALYASETPAWFVSGGKLYIKAVAGSDVTANPIYIPEGNFAIKAPLTYGLTLCNVETWYGNIVVDGGHRFEAYDSASKYTVGDGAWEIDGCLSAYLERCEADSNTMATAASGSNPKGDGFNIHPTSASNIYARTGTHTLVDCWGHDNRDDGYSDHGWNNDGTIGGASGTIIGGLFEYNVQGGLTPSTGAHDTIIGALCRRQKAGIHYTGDSGHGDVRSIACVCVNNWRNFRCKAAASAGDNQNVMVLERCTSRNASIAGYSVGAHATMYLHECTDYGSAMKKATEDNTGTFVVENGTTVTPED